MVFLDSSVASGVDWECSGDGNLYSKASESLYSESPLNLSCEAESVCTFIKTKQGEYEAAGMHAIPVGKRLKNPHPDTKVC